MGKKLRSIRVEGGVAYIPLTQGYEAVIDAEDVPLVDGYNWYADVKKRTVYVGTNKSLGGGKQKRVDLHRLLANPSPTEHVDHKNHNGLDNRRNNLRVCGRSQNMWNSQKHLRTTSGFKGVYWDNPRGRWRAAIRVFGKLKYLGLFDTPEEASQAYQEASERYHKEFGHSGENCHTV